ncbi:hypothetical protein Tco_0459359 [Tanacetum coccineum]
MVPFIKELRYIGKCDMLFEIYRNHIHHPWSTFAAVNNSCIFGKSTGLDRLGPSRAQILWGIFYQKNVDYVSLLWEEFMFQADHREISSTRKENMPYPKFTKVIINHFISKDKSISMRNWINLHTVRDDTLLESNEVQKPALPLKKQTLVLEDEPIKKSKRAAKSVLAKEDVCSKKPSGKKSGGVVIRDTPCSTPKLGCSKIRVRECYFIDQHHKI